MPSRIRVEVIHSRNGKVVNGSLKRIESAIAAALLATAPVDKELGLIVRAFPIRWQRILEIVKLYNRINTGGKITAKVFREPRNKLVKKPDSISPVIKTRDEPESPRTNSVGISSNTTAGAASAFRGRLTSTSNNMRSSF